MRGLGRAVLIVLATITAAFVFAVSALAAGDIMLTFVRHAESQANADGIINTEVPGPHITELGQQQGDAVATLLSSNEFDGIYASDMVRTQETAAPLAALLDKQVTTLPGLHEINAGIYEGSSEDSGLGRLGYALAPLAWTLGLRFVPIPGSTDANGNAFEARMNDAVQTIYDSGEENAVAFSHGATIMFWTMMNVDNPDLGLLLTHQLGNTGVVVVEGNPEDGWNLVNWDGVAVDANPSFGTKLFVNVRDLVTAPQKAAFAVSEAIKAGDLAAAAKAFVNGVVATVLAPIRFGVAVARDVADEVHGVVGGRSEPVTSNAKVGSSDAAVDSTPDLTTGSPAVSDAADRDGTSAVATDSSPGKKFGKARDAAGRKAAGGRADSAPAGAAEVAAPRIEAETTDKEQNSGTSARDEVAIKRARRAADKEAGKDMGKEAAGAPDRNHPAVSATRRHPHKHAADASHDTTGASDGRQDAA